MLRDRREAYKVAVERLKDGKETQLFLVSRAEESSVREAERSSVELGKIGMRNQVLVVNGIYPNDDDKDLVFRNIYDKQQEVLVNIPKELSQYKIYGVPMRSYNLDNVERIRHMLHSDELKKGGVVVGNLGNEKGLKDLISDLYKTGKRVIFTMGKGGVGKTTIATEIAIGLHKMGAKVHITTTDPANHLNESLMRREGISMSHIDEKEVLEAYKEEVRGKVRGMMSEADMEYIEEDLRSPCTQEIAVFRAFAKIVYKAEEEIVVIDTAPTGHTLLLLDSTESYDKEIQRTQGDSPEYIRKLLPRLRNEAETEVVIVTLPEATPVYEAERLQKDLKRAGISNKWWVVNSCMLFTDTKNDFLREKAKSEVVWIEKVRGLCDGNMAVVGKKI